MSARDGLAAAVEDATRRLADAGVPSPRADAETLAAHLLGVGRGELVARVLRGDGQVPPGLGDLVAERSRRVPLQHLTGVAGFRGLDVRVGPGVFVPRPETEVVAGLAVDAAAALVRSGRRPVVVDLCTGSGAIALCVATEVPGARVHAVELSRRAHAWAQQNLAGTHVDLRLGDAATAFDDLDDAVDVVVTNPPYIPPGAVPIDPEVRDHDPAVALFGLGPDGLDVPRAVLLTAARLLRDGGLVVVEHAEVQQPALLGMLGPPRWAGATGHRDLAGSPRCVTATRRR